MSDNSANAARRLKQEEEWKKRKAEEAEKRYFEVRNQPEPSATA